METIPREDLTRTCTRCNERKPLSEFVPKTKNQVAKLKNPNDEKNHYTHRCKQCYNEYHVIWRSEQGDKYRTAARKQYHKRKAKMSPDELSKFMEDQAQKVRVRTKTKKDQVYAAYGGYNCSCCGETEPSFLTIDHMYNNGAQMRREVHGPTGIMMLNWLIKNNFPEGFQILCWNCQWGKVKNNGVCPHQVTRNDYPERE